MTGIIEVTYLQQIAVTDEATLEVFNQSGQSCLQDHLMPRLQVYRLNGQQVPFRVDLMCSPSDLITITISEPQQLRFSSTVTCQELHWTQPYPLQPATQSTRPDGAGS